MKSRETCYVCLLKPFMFHQRDKQNIHTSNHQNFHFAKKAVIHTRSSAKLSTHLFFIEPQSRWMWIRRMSIDIIQLRWSVKSFKVFLVVAIVMWNYVWIVLLFYQGGWCCLQKHWMKRKRKGKSSKKGSNQNIMSERVWRTVSNS